MSIISLSEVSYRYGAHVLLDCADLNIAEGDQLALVGRNGCGKTSLLKLISGEHLPDSGLIERKNGSAASDRASEIHGQLKKLRRDFPSEFDSGEFRISQTFSDKRAENASFEAADAEVIEGISPDKSLNESDVGRNVSRRTSAAKQYFFHRFSSFLQ